jgi:hypothetical protein
VAHPWRTSPAWSAVVRALGLSTLAFMAGPWLFSADDPAWRADSLAAAVALAAVAGGTWCLRRARAARRWRAALDRYAEQEHAKGTRARKGPHARPRPGVPAPPLPTVKLGAVFQWSEHS